MDSKKITNRIGWAALMGLAVWFLIHGQIYILTNKNIIIGILNSITCLIITTYLFRLEQKGVGLFKALILGAVLIYYNYVAYCSSLVWDVGTYTVGMTLAGMLLFMTIHSPFKVFSGPERNPEVMATRQRLGKIFIWMAVILFAMAASVVWSKKYMSAYDYTSVMNWFFVLRSHGVIGDIPSAPFREWGKLGLPLLYLIVLLVSLWFIVFRQKMMGVWKSLLLLFVLGNAGGLIMAKLSTSGMHVLQLQVTSIHYHFYNMAKSFQTFSEVWNMVGTYATREIHHWVSFPATHPPFAIVMNWLLIKFTGDNVTLIALILGSLAYTGVFPMYLIGREYYNREIGLYMAALFIVLPSTLIINHISLDAFTASLTAWAVALVLIGCRREKPWIMFLAGLAVAGIAATNYVTPLIMSALFLLALTELRNMGKPQEGLLAWIKAAIPKAVVFLFGIAIPYLLVEISTQWKFDYIAMLKHTTFVINTHGTRQRPWFVGCWLGWFGYFNHVGLPVTALFILRWREILKGDWRNDALPWAGIVIMLVPFIMGIGRQETERQFMIFNVFVIATAALALWKRKEPFRYMIRPVDNKTIPEMGGGWRGLFFLMVTLSYINAVVVQMLVVDHW